MKKTRFLALAVCLLTPALRGNPDPVSEVCAAFLAEVTGLFEPITNAYTRAMIAHPASPIARGLELKQALVEAGVASKEANKATAFQRESEGEGVGVFWNGNPMPNMRVREHPILNTVIYTPAEDVARKPQDARVYVPALSGSGAVWSHGGSALGLVSTLGTANGGKFRSRVEKDNPYFTPTISATLDMPSHGAGPLRPQMSIPEMHRYLDFVVGEEFSHGLPVVPIPRSASAFMVADWAIHNPGKVSGVLMISPFHPEAGIERSMENEQRELGSTPPVYLPNISSFQMIFNQYRQMRNRAEGAWYHRLTPFGELPVVILLGETDAEVPPEARQVYHDWTRHSPNVHCFVIKGVGHDVLGIRGGKNPDHTPTVEAYRLVHWFLATQVLKTHSGEPTASDWYWPIADSGFEVH